jgi:putative NADH-flavin reductase
MKLIIFGATGTVGIRLVEQALQSGYQVTAFTRSPQKLSSIKHPNLTVFKGDILDASAVQKAVDAHDCVLCAIGDGNKGMIRASGTKNILSAMKNSRTKRLLCQTTLGLGESKGNLNFFWKHIMFGFLLKKAFSDHEMQEKYIFESNLDWTIVRPSAFTNGPLTREYKYDFGADETKLKLKISRADVADFMLKQLTTDTFLRKAVSISS